MFARSGLSLLQKFSLYSVVDKKYARKERSYKYCRESIIYFKVKKNSNKNSFSFPMMTSVAFF